MAHFDARQAAAEAEAEYPTFTFDDMDGVERALPHPANMRPDDLKRIDTAMKATGSDDQSDDGIQDLMDAIDALFGDELGEAVRAMGVATIFKLMEAWQGQVTEEGKSPSPPSGPNREQRRSKQTSRSKGSTSGRSPSGKSRAASKS